MGLYSKNDLRKFYIKQREIYINHYQNTTYQEIIRKKLVSLLNDLCGISQSQTLEIAGYYPIKSELNILPMLENFKRNLYSLTDKPCNISIPSIINNEDRLEFFRYDKDGLTSDQKYGIPQMVPNSEHIIPNVIIVPLLAYDKQHYRLGYGKGMYDRTINRLKEENHQFVTVSIIFPFMQMNHPLPHNQYDQKVDYLIEVK